MRRVRSALAVAALAVLTAACGPAVSDPGATTVPRATARATGPAATPVASSVAATATATAVEPTADTSALGPPRDRYLCYLVPSYTYNGYVELLDGGRYEAGYTRGEPRTSGSYSYSAASNQVVWSGGDYEELWPVAYYVQPGVYPDGSKREGTGADRHTIALKVDHSNPRLPGQEVGSNPIYVYCYQEVD